MTTRTCIEIALIILAVYFGLMATVVGRTNAVLVSAAAGIATLITLFVYVLN